MEKKDMDIVYWLLYGAYALGFLSMFLIYFLATY